MIIEKINNQELQEVVELDNTIHGNQGFGSSTAIKDQRVKRQRSKTRCYKLGLVLVILAAGNLLI